MKCYENMGVITIKSNAKWLFTISIWINFSSDMIALKSFEENNFIKMQEVKKTPLQTPTKTKQNKKKRCSGKILNPESKAKLNTTGKIFPSVSALLLISERVHTIQDYTYFTFFFIRSRKAHFYNCIQKFQKGHSK